MLDSLASGDLAPIVAERVPLTEARRAHQLLENGHHNGKIVLVPNRRERELVVENGPEEASRPGQTTLKSRLCVARSALPASDRGQAASGVAHSPTSTTCPAASDIGTYEFEHALQNDGGRPCR